MLNSLRKNLTLLCVFMTGIILSLTAMGLLFLSERQMDQQSSITFQNNLNSIVYKLQSSHTIDNQWLSQLETGNQLIVHIEDNGTPILFPGSWTPESDRAALIAKVQETARTQYAFDIKTKPYSVINIDSQSFEITGDNGDEYQAAVAVIPSSGKSWQSITLLRDISADVNQKLMARLSFLGLIIAALALLFLFSWWFSGRVIAPIEESRRKQVEFVASASHELRSPLAVIQASLSAFSGAPEQGASFLAAAQRECLRMAGLIDDLLFLASSDAGTWSVRTEAIEPDTLMLELYESFEPLALKNGQNLSLSLPEEAVREIPGDKQRLFQALSVLVNNALSYTPKGGHIVLRAAEDKHSLSLSVSDDGPGVPDEQKEKIFDRFYRADPSRSKKEHYGLGLAVAREIADLHGGTLTVSDAPGGGAAFTIRLAVKQAARADRT